MTREPFITTVNFITPTARARTRRVRRIIHYVFPANDALMGSDNARKFSRESRFAATRSLEHLAMMPGPTSPGATPRSYTQRENRSHFAVQIIFDIPSHQTPPFAYILMRRLYKMDIETYEKYHQIARQVLSKWPNEQSWTSRDLLGSALLGLHGSLGEGDWRGPRNGHPPSYLRQVMYSKLVDKQRRDRAEKRPRGGGRTRVHEEIPLAEHPRAASPIGLEDEAARIYGDQPPPSRDLEKLIVLARLRGIKPRQIARDLPVPGDDINRRMRYVKAKLRQMQKKASRQSDASGARP